MDGPSIDAPPRDAIRYVVVSTVDGLPVARSSLRIRIPSRMIVGSCATGSLGATGAERAAEAGAATRSEASRATTAKSFDMLALFTILSRVGSTAIQRKVQESIDRLVARDVEQGIQVAVFQHGRQIVDAVAGLADPDTTRAVTPDTPFLSFSIGKGLTAAVANLLVDRGVLQYDLRVAKVWPQFAKHGKDDVTLRHVLTHSAGVPGLPIDTSPRQLCDWETICKAVADQPLWWTPGTKVGYHSYTFGFIVGEIVRRVTGARISDFLRDDVAKPLGIPGEIAYGTPEAEQEKLAVLEGGEKQRPSLLAPTPEMGNDPAFRAAEIPSIGTVSARGIARVYAALLGEVDGVRLVPEERLKTMTAEAASGEDAVFGTPSTWALGWALGRPGSTPEATPTVFGMAGAGGSFAWGDTARGLSFAVTKNRLATNFSTATHLSNLVVAALR
jgi:CubicO group peptidase (beta-lactamase class C family)